jgi:hypothetical protein
MLRWSSKSRCRVQVTSNVRLRIQSQEELVKLSLEYVFLATVVLQGCGTAPMSMIEANPPLRLLPANHFPVRVVSIDGSIQFQMPVRVAPGPHMLVLEAQGSSVSKSRVQRTFAFKVEPCTRYYLLAAKESINAASWELVIHSTEKVALCNPEEEVKKS